jgi:hypothetical protein
MTFNSEMEEVPSITKYEAGADKQSRPVPKRVTVHGMESLVMQKKKLDSI